MKENTSKGYTALSAEEQSILESVSGNQFLEMSFLKQHEKFLMHKLLNLNMNLLPNVSMSRPTSEEHIQALSASLGVKILLEVFSKAN